MVLVPLGGLDVGHPDGLTTYGSTTAAVRALGRAVGYARWRAVPAAPLPVTDHAQALAARQWCRSKLQHAATEGRWLAASEARHLLDAYGLRLVGRVVTGAERAVEEAARIGFPVAIKLADASGAHKSERRLVRTGLDVDVRRTTGGGGVRGRAQERRARSPGATHGVRRGGGPRGRARPDHGAAGHGGRWRRGDRPVGRPRCSCFRRSPWPTPSALCEVCESHHCSGVRGARAADVADLERLIVDLGRLAVDVPEIAELDLNPVMVGAYTCSIVDVRLRMASTDDPGPGAPRQLRRVD